MPNVKIIPQRFEKIAATTLSSGSHKNPADGMCVMEAVAWISGEPFSDQPECACPVISAFLRSWNDALSETDRNTLLKPLIVKLVGTKSTSSVETRRAVMSTDWLIRTHTPAWLRLAKLNDQAASLESLPKITDLIDCRSLMPVLNEVRSDANAARNAARDAAKDDAAWAAARTATREAAGEAARDAAWEADAAGAAARDAAGDAARATGRTAAGEAARDAAWAANAAGDAAKDAAWTAATAALAPTVAALQSSALDLVNRMIDAREAEHA